MTLIEQVRKIVIEADGEVGKRITFKYKAYLGDVLVGFGDGHGSYESAEIAGNDAIQSQIDSELEWTDERKLPDTIVMLEEVVTTLEKLTAHFKMLSNPYHNTGVYYVMAGQSNTFISLNEIHSALMLQERARKMLSDLKGEGS